MDVLEFRLTAPDPERELWVEYCQAPQTIVEIWLNGQEAVL